MGDISVLFIFLTCPHFIGVDRHCVSNCLLIHHLLFLFVFNVLSTSLAKQLQSLESNFRLICKTINYSWVETISVELFFKGRTVFSYQIDSGNIPRWIISHYILLFRKINSSFDHVYLSPACQKTGSICYLLARFKYI